MTGAKTTENAFRVDSDGVLMSTGPQKLALFPLECWNLVGHYTSFFNQIRQTETLDVHPVEYVREHDGTWSAAMTMECAEGGIYSGNHTFFTDTPSENKRLARDKLMVCASAVLPDICNGASDAQPLSYHGRRVGFVDTSGKIVLT